MKSECKYELIFMVVKFLNIQLARRLFKDIYVSFDSPPNFKCIFFFLFLLIQTFVRKCPMLRRASDFP